MIYGKIISYLSSLRAKLNTDNVLETLDSAGTTRTSIKGNGQTTINKNTTGDVLDVQTSGTSKFKVSDTAITSTIGMNGKAYTVESTISDNVGANGSPWYGMGYSTVVAGGGYYTQVAGYHGLRLRSSSGILDVNPSYVGSNVPVKQGCAVIQDGFADVDPQEGITAVFRNGNATDTSTEAFFSIGQGYASINATTGKSVNIGANNTNGISVYSDNIQVYQPTTINKATAGIVLDVQYSSNSKLKVSDTAITASVPIVGSANYMLGESGSYGFLWGKNLTQSDANYSLAVHRDGTYSFLNGSAGVGLNVGNTQKLTINSTAITASVPIASSSLQTHSTVGDASPYATPQFGIGKTNVDVGGGNYATGVCGFNRLQLESGNTIAMWMRSGTLQVETGWTPYTRTAWTTNSDARLKYDIKDSALGLDFVMKLRPTSYKLKLGKIEHETIGYEPDVVEMVDDGTGTDTLIEKVTKGKAITKENTIAGVRDHYGFIAQEVEAVLEGRDFAGFIRQDDEDKTLGLRYEEFIAPMVKAMQEQQAIIEALTKRIEALENK